MILAEWNGVHPYPHGSRYLYYFQLYYPSISFHQPGSYSAIMHIKLMMRLLLNKIPVDTACNQIVSIII